MAINVYLGRAHMAKKELSDVERILIALTSLALNAPSTYTIAWSKQEHKEQMPILYAGIGTSAATVVGALLGKRWYGDKIMWIGLVGTLGLFAYVTFFYNPNSSTVKVETQKTQAHPTFAVAKGTYV